jgi:hypothetical protein
MSDWTLNGAPIVTGTLTVPRVGAWMLDAIAVSDDPIEGPVELAEARCGDGFSDA